MVGLNILPNKKKQQGHTTVLLESGSKHGGGSEGRCTSGSSVPALQQQGEGELSDILENFLQSFEQNVESCSTREEMEKEVQSCTEAVRSKHRKTRSGETGRLQSDFQQHQSSLVPKEPAEVTTTPGKAPPTQPRKRRRRARNQFWFSLEKKRVRVRTSSSEAKGRTVPDRGDKQLLQMPVVKLERSGLLPERVTLQGPCRQSLKEVTNFFNMSALMPLIISAVTMRHIRLLMLKAKK